MGDANGFVRLVDLKKGKIMGKQEVKRGLQNFDMDWSSSGLAVGSECQ